ncbi:MAG: hypothetical protein C0582_04855 [Alphaproteobacteria bacterium]|nr:MAG: hypothetical protein C0582_04855 [Alphaproteobacteria bacterium]
MFKKIFILALSIIAGGTYAVLPELPFNPVQVQKVKSGIENHFDTLPSAEEKQSFVTTALNHEYIENFTNARNAHLGEGFSINTALRTSPTNFVEHFRRHQAPVPYLTPASVAILLGDKDLTTKFLSILPDVNSLQTLVAGYRQVINLAQIAVDPHYPYSLACNPHETWKENITNLALLGVDLHFNSRDHYDNPPLVMVYANLYGQSDSYLEEQRTRPQDTSKLREDIQTHLLLLGAKPEGGSAIFFSINHFLGLNPDEILDDKPGRIRKRVLENHYWLLTHHKDLINPDNEITDLHWKTQAPTSPTFSEALEKLLEGSRQHIKLKIALFLNNNLYSDKIESFKQSLPRK